MTIQSAHYQQIDRTVLPKNAPATNDRNADYRNSQIASAFAYSLLRRGSADQGLWAYPTQQRRQIARYAGDDAQALEQLIGDREGVSPEQVILGEILDSLGLQLALDGGAGGEFVYSEPGYTALVDAVAPGGGVVVGVPLNAHLENDLPAIATRVTARTRAIYISNPHNPTGTASEAVPFKAFLREMARGTTVIVDEAYLDFEPDFAQKTAVE